MTPWETTGPDHLNLAGVSAAVLEMERNGIALDVEGCRRSEAVAAADEASALSALRTHATTLDHFLLASPQLADRIDGVWTSPQQLQVFLHSELGLNLPPSPFWKKGRVKLDRGEVKLDAVALAYLAGHHPEHRDFLNAVLHRKKVWASLKYLRKLPDYVAPDGRMHPIFGSAGDSDERVGAVTGRLAAKLPEVHQIPTSDRYGIRSFFVAGEGKVLVVVDYSALEVVILAHIILVLFGDDQLARMVDPSAPDIHSVNALRVFRDVLGNPMEGAEEYLAAHPREGFKNSPDKFTKWTRSTIKTIWYGLQYGKGAWGFGNGLFDQRGDPLGEKRAGDMVEGILTAIPGLRRYQEWVMDFITTHGGVPSLSGRWCDLRALVESGDEWQVKRAWRRALNYPMQAGGADIMGALMVAVMNHPRLRALGAETVMQIHDELVIRCPTECGAEVLSIVQELASTCYPLALPLQTSGGVAPNWAEGKHA